MRNWLTIGGIVLSLFSGTLLASSVSGQANMRNVLPGGRASMMGGAYTALSDDPSGAYYNPGGLGFLSDHSFDVSATAYRYQSVVYKDAVNNEALNQQSTNIYPSFLGVAARLGVFTLGYSFLSLDQRSIYQQNKFTNISPEQGALSSYEQTHQEENTHVLAGGSLAMRLGSRWAAGLSLYYYQRTINATTIELSKSNGGGLWSTTHRYQTLNTGVAPIFGVKGRFGMFAIGLSVKWGRAITDRTDIITDQIRYEPIDSNSTPITQRSEGSLDELNELNPTTYRGGASFTPAEWFTVAADLLVHEGKKNHHVAGNQNDLQTTYDMSIGMELGRSAGGLRAGYFTNHSLFAKPSAGEVNQPSHINYTGYTIGFGWRLGGFQGELGAVQQTGRGFAQILTDSEGIQDVEAINTMFSMSGNISMD